MRLIVTINIMNVNFPSFNLTSFMMTKEPSIKILEFIFTPSHYNLYKTITY